MYTWVHSSTELPPPAGFCMEQYAPLPCLTCSYSLSLSRSLSGVGRFLLPVSLTPLPTTWEEGISPLSWYKHLRSMNIYSLYASPKTHTASALSMLLYILLDSYTHMYACHNLSIYCNTPYIYARLIRFLHACTFFCSFVACHAQYTNLMDSCPRGSSPI